VRSYIATARKQHQSVLGVLHLAFAASRGCSSPLASHWPLLLDYTSCIVVKLDHLMNSYIEYI
jgi:hypothetical protein